MIPKNNAAFENEDKKQLSGWVGRVDFDSVYPVDKKHGLEIPSSVVCNIQSIAEGVTQDILSKKLFLRALSQMIAHEGGHTNAEKAFANIAELSMQDARYRGATSLYSSHLLYMLHHFPSIPFADKKWTTLGPPETTTSYGFQFQFPHMADFKTKSITQGFSTSSYHLDARAFEVLENFGVTTAFRRHYLEGFMQMAEMAEHGYIHQLASPMKGYADWYYPDEVNRYVDREPFGVLQDWERYVLATHAHACHWVFGEHLLKPVKEDLSAISSASTFHDREPRSDLTSEQLRALAVGRQRKQKTLAQAETVFSGLLEMQAVANAQATTDKDRARVKEAITYLAEIYAHRFFRVISPEDIDLRHSKAAAVCDGLSFVMPPKNKELQPDAHGIQGLRLLCGTYLGDIYAEIHGLTALKMITEVQDIHHFLTEKQHRIFTPAQFIDHMVQDGLPKLQQHWETEMGQPYVDKRVYADPLLKAEKSR